MVVSYFKRDRNNKKTTKLQVHCLLCGLGGGERSGQYFKIHSFVLLWGGYLVNIPRFNFFVVALGVRSGQYFKNLKNSCVLGARTQEDPGEPRRAQESA